MDARYANTRYTDARYADRGYEETRRPNMRYAETYSVRAFARMAGVTVRTLQFYDNEGLLPPTLHTQAGHRRYRREDLLRLQQILTLRYLGFALKQIRELLDRPDFDIAASLAIQQRALRDRIAELERIDTALGELLGQWQATGEWAWDLVTRAATTVQAELEQRGEKMSEYYTPEELERRLAEIGKDIPSETIRQREQEWGALAREVRVSHDLDPASAQAQALAARWNAMTREIALGFQGDAKLLATVQRNYATGAYAEIADAPTMEDFAFIERANKARKGEKTE